MGRAAHGTEHTQRAHTHTQRAHTHTHTPLASSFLFNERHTAHPEEEPHGRNLKKEQERGKEKSSTCPGDYKVNEALWQFIMASLRPAGALCSSETS